MSMYNLYSYNEDLDVPYHQSPTVLVNYSPLPMHLEEVHSSPVTKKIVSERYSMIQEEDNLSSYNIEEIFDAFTFNLYKKEVSRKRIWSVKQNDGTMKEIQEDEVLFEKIDEDMKNWCSFCAFFNWRSRLDEMSSPQFNVDPLVMTW